MNTKNIVLALPLALALLSSATAQVNHVLMGVTRTTATVMQSRHLPCTALGGCNPAGMPANPGSWAAGGTAYDGTNDSVWVTTGQLLGRYTATSACNPICPPGPCPKSSAAAVASGLDVVESLNQLWIVDDQGWLTRTTLSCPPVVLGSCALGIAPGEVPTGIAVDDGRGIVFVTTVNAAGARLYVSQIGTPCAPFTVSWLFDCSAGAVPCFGVAADWGNAILYWTDGPSTYSFPYAYNPAGPSIAYGATNCCNLVISPNDPYTDLTLRPRTGTPAGNPCANGTCPTCLPYHGLRNAPILGNTLQLGLDSAPEASFAWCLLSLGACTAGPTFPPLCGPLWLTPSWTLGFNITSGTFGCTGSTTFLLPLPTNPAFAGLPLASQCVVLCGGGTGTALSNCQSWVLLGS